MLSNSSPSFIPAAIVHQRPQSHFVWEKNNSPKHDSFFQQNFIRCLLHVRLWGKHWGRGGGTAVTPQSCDRLSSPIPGNSPELQLTTTTDVCDTVPNYWERISLCPEHLCITHSRKDFQEHEHSQKDFFHLCFNFSYSHFSESLLSGAVLPRLKPQASLLPPSPSSQCIMAFPVLWGYRFKNQLSGESTASPNEYIRQFPWCKFSHLSHATNVMGQGTELERVFLSGGYNRWK